MVAVDVPTLVSRTRKLRPVVTDAGFTRFRRVAETPFNNVYEARP